MWLHGTQKHDVHCSDKTNMALQISMTVPEVKSVLLYGTQKINNRCTGNARVIAWCSKLPLTDAVIRPVWLYGIQKGH